MYQKNLIYRHNTAFRDCALRMRDSILRDATFVNYVKSKLPEDQRNGELTNEQLLSGLKQYAESQKDEALKVRFTALFEAVSELSYFDSRVYSFHKVPEGGGKGIVTLNDPDGIVSSKNWGDAVRKINQVNGYIAERSDFFLKAQQEATVQQEPSLLELVHQKFEADGYNAVEKNNKDGMLALHLGQLGEDLMTELAEFKQQTDLDNYREDNLLTVDDKNDAEQKLMNEIFEADRKFNFPPKGRTVFELMLDEEAFKKYQSELDAKKAEFDRKSQLDDEEITRLILEDEGTKKYLENKRAEIEEAVRNEIPPKYLQDIEKLRNKLELEASQNAALNEDIKTENEQIEKTNAECRQQIKEIEEKLQKDLKELKDMDRADVERIDRARWSYETDLYERQYAPLKDQLDELTSRFNAVIDGDSAAANIANNVNMPPKEHFDAVKKETAVMDAFDRISSNLYEIGGNERGAAYLDRVITKDVLKEYKSKAEKVKKYEEKMASLTAKLNGKSESKVTKGASELQELALKLGEAKEEVEKMGPAGKALAALDDFKKNYPELNEEFSKAKKENKGANDYAVMSSLVKKHLQNVNDLKSKYPDYYRDVEKVAISRQRLNYDPNEKEKLAERINEIGRRMDALVKPKTKEEFEAELQEKLSGLPSKEELEARKKALETEAKGKIAELKDKMDVTQDLFEVKSREEIDAEVEKEKHFSEIGYECTVSAEVKKRMAEETKRYADFNVRTFRSKLFDIKTKYSNDSTNLSILRRRAKEMHENAVKRNDRIPEVKAKWNATIQPDDSDAIASLEKRLNRFAADIDKGTEDGHKNTESFKGMKKAVQDAAKWVSEHKEALQSGNRNTLNAMKEQLASVQAATQHYIEKKQGGIHWSPSNMRFVRLQYAADLSQFCEKATAKVDRQLAYVDKRAAAGEETIRFMSSSKHIEKFPDYKNYMQVCKVKYAPKAPVAGEANEAARENVRENEINGPELGK